MKNKPFISILLVTMVICAQTYAIDLIPQPVEMKALDGSMTLTKKSTIAYNSPEARKVAEMLAQKLSVPTGFVLKARQGDSGAIQLSLNQSADPAIGKEGYVLEARPTQS